MAAQQPTRETNQKVTTHFYAHYLDDAWYGIRDS